jgi:hypothetical protein
MVQNYFYDDIKFSKVENTFTKIDIVKIIKSNVETKVILKDQYGNSVEYSHSPVQTIEKIKRNRSTSTCSADRIYLFPLEADIIFDDKRDQLYRRNDQVVLIHNRMSYIVTHIEGSVEKEINLNVTAVFGSQVIRESFSLPIKMLDNCKKVINDLSALARPTRVCGSNWYTTLDAINQRQKTLVIEKGKVNQIIPLDDVTYDLENSTPYLEVCGRVETASVCNKYIFPFFSDISSCWKSVKIEVDGSAKCRTKGLKFYIPGETRLNRGIFYWEKNLRGVLNILLDGNMVSLPSHDGLSITSDNIFQIKLPVDVQVPFDSPVLQRDILNIPILDLKDSICLKMLIDVFVQNQSNCEHNFLAFHQTDLNNKLISTIVRFVVGDGGIKVGDEKPVSYYDYQIFSIENGDVLKLTIKSKIYYLRLTEFCRSLLLERLKTNQVRRRLKRNTRY